MSYVFTKPKTTDFSRIQGVFSSRSAISEFEFQRDHKISDASRAFFCTDAKQACLIDRMSMKKANSTRSVLFRRFGLAQCGGKSVKCNKADNPKNLWHAFVVFFIEFCGTYFNLLSYPNLMISVV